VQHPGYQMQPRPDAGRVVGFQGPGRAPQPPLAFAELPRPDCRLGQGEQRGRDHRFGPPAVPLGQRYHLPAAFPGRGQGTGRHGPELGEAAYLEIRAADLPGQGGTLPQVAFGVGERQGPRLDRSEVHQADGPQVAGERDLLAAPPGHRSGQEPGLLHDTGQVAAALGQPQMQRRDRQLQAAAATGRRRLGVRRGDGQMGGRLVQMPLEQVAARADEGQLGIGGGAGREGPDQHLDGPGLPVQGQAQRMVGQQPGRLGPVARRLGVPDGVDGLAMAGEPRGGPPVQGRHVLGQCPAQLQPEQIPEQLVEAEPGPSGVKRHHERVRVLEFQQDPFRSRPPGQHVG
jgi:hypothetical protein